MFLTEGKKIAIYARKSKFTGKGDSIDAQIKLCRNEIYRVFENVSDDDIVVFQDEGYSGGNINRPSFTKMMKQVENNEFDAVCIYKLDRFSRNVGDFANTYSILEKTETAFLSVTESYDTTNPMGKAMMSVAVVFAQLERETTAERIRDNLYELSKTGRWLGGTTPTGYKSQKISADIKIDGKKRTAYKLEIIPEEAEIIKLIFNKYIEEKSLTKVVSYLLRSGIKSKTNTDYSRFAVKAILENPVYAPNDVKIYDYFNELGSEIFSEKSEFNGKHGMMVYNKTNQISGKAHTKKDTKEWVVAIGKHKPLVSSDMWLEAQSLLNENSSKSYRKPKSTTAVLSGLLCCGECGAFMRPKADNRRKTPEGDVKFTYRCEMKLASNKSRCSMRDVNGNKLDKLIIDKIKEIAANSEEIYKDLKKKSKAELDNQKTYKAELQQLLKARKDAEKAIENGNKNMLIDMSPETAKGIIEVIEAKRKELETLNINISKIEEAISASELTLAYFDEYMKMYADFGNNFDKLDAIEKNRMLRTIIDKIIWNGEVPVITMIGANEATADNDAPQCEDSKRNSDAFQGKEEGR